MDVTVERAVEADRRWRLTRDVQRETINRLLADRGRTLDDEHHALTAEVVELRARVERVVDMLVGRRGSTVARQVLAVLDPDEP